jgi:outer membrane lipoprotein-sorting protein
MDFYLDPSTFLPLAIAFAAHPNQDALTDIATEVRFANYQPVNGVLVPFHIQQMLSGGVILDITITAATFNTGIPASTFSLQ